MRKKDWTNEKRKRKKRLNHSWRRLVRWLWKIPCKTEVHDNCIENYFEQWKMKKQEAIDGCKEKIEARHERLYRSHTNNWMLPDWIGEIGQCVSTYAGWLNRRLWKTNDENSKINWMGKKKCLKICDRMIHLVSISDRITRPSIDRLNSIFFTLFSHLSFSFFVPRLRWSLSTDQQPFELLCNEIFVVVSLLFWTLNLNKSNVINGKIFVSFSIVISSYLER